MSIYDKIAGVERPRIPVHAFCASLFEIALGFQTISSISTAYSLTPAEVTELTNLVGTISGNKASQGIRVLEIESVLVQAESQVLYRTTAEIKTRLQVP